MNELTIKLENCYGIKKFDHKFNLASSKDHVIYAPNGCMKSSFARTLEDISLNKASIDRIFSDRINHRSVQVDARDIRPEEIFVIHRMKEAEFKEASTILANEVLKKEYDLVNIKLNESKQVFTKRIQPNIGIKDNQIDTLIEKVFANDIFTVLENLKDQIDAIEEPLYSTIIYSEIFNEKSERFLGEKSFNIKVREYISVYDQLIDEKESLFKRGDFNHFNAETITKSLKDNGFFKANHKVKIKDLEIADANELEKLINDEKNKILSNPELVSKFNEIDKALNSNSELRKFRQYITENQDVIKELVNLENFKKKLFINYFSLHKIDVDFLRQTYIETSKRRNELIVEAKKEQTEWIKVIGIFQNRFSVPFRIKVKNQEDVILKNEPASLIFTYTDGENEIDLGGADINNSLSTGEQRVFYLLNIIFQLELRKKNEFDQVIIVDDIADSFDYKNKYAIIEYLRDISEDSKFKLFILTHNFDFYKTIKKRLKNVDNWHGNHVAIKRSDGITIVNGETKDVFESLRQNFPKCEFSFIACIPFVRNLIEYTVGDKDSKYLLLTSLLHMKPYNAENDIKSTKDQEIGDVLGIFNSVFGITETMPDPSIKVYDLILTKAQELIKAHEPVLDIKSKLCLSIAIRLMAEEYIISKVVNADFHLHIQKKETGKIVEQYKREFKANFFEIDIFDRVNLMTAENIHINSFMYEPLMDLSDNHLRKLYADVVDLVGK